MSRALKRLMWGATLNNFTNEYLLGKHRPSTLVNRHKLSQILLAYTILLLKNVKSKPCAVMALKKGALCKKSKGGHYLVCQKKVAEAVLVYETKVVTKRKVSVFPKSWCSLKKKRSSLPIHFRFPNFFPKS